jgi:hypothetical protein
LNPFIVLFSLITLISVVISGALLLLRRRGGGRWRTQDHIHPSVFSFFTTLYAFFIGFAIVTLWSAFLTAKTNVTREADAIMIVYRTAKNLPGSGAFRQALINYVKAVVEDEWRYMQKGSMSPVASQEFDDIWSHYYLLKSDPNKSDEIHTNLTEAGRQRSSRASILQGNLYPPVWVILFFGVVSVTFGLYFINREPTLVSLVYEFMVIFLLLSCIYFIYDLDTPFSGLINVKPEAFQTVYQKMLSLP